MYVCLDFRYSVFSKRSLVPLKKKKKKRSLVHMGSIVHTWWCRYLKDVALGLIRMSLRPKWFEVFTLDFLRDYSIPHFCALLLTSHIVPRFLTLTSLAKFDAQLIWLDKQLFCLIGQAGKNSLFSFSFFLLVA